MPSESAPDTWPERARFIVLILFLSACFLWGGGSRLDILGLAIVQPAAIICIAAIILVPGPVHWESVRVPLALLGGLAIIMAVQLIPLPPSLWSELPGHEPFSAIATTAGLEPTWRPISLTPDLTLASLVGLVVPAAALVAFASLPEHRTHRLLPFLLVAAGLSAMLGLAQIVSGTLYRYEVTNEGAAVGFFSNRNHQAVLLAMTWPLLALWASQPVEDPLQSKARLWIAGAAAVFLFPMIAATGSRAGLALAAVGLLAAWQQLRVSEPTTRPARRGAIAPLLRVAPVLLGLAIVAVAFTLSRAEAIERLFSSSLSADRRAEHLPILLQITSDFFPFGSGFGSFDPVFRFYEPFNLLRSTYLNHAHNDLLELAITGGVPALVLVLLFLAWVVPRTIMLFRTRSPSRAKGFGRIAAAMIAIILLSSLIDYPLRTPLLAALFALACGWIGASRPRQARSAG